MSATTLLIGLLPIVLFVILDLYAKPKVAVIASVVLAIALGIYSYFAFAEWDHSITAEILLFLVFGGISLKMKRPELFKYQPVVVGLAMALFLLGYELWSGPYFVRAATLMSKLNPELAAPLATPHMQAVLAAFSRHSIVIFALHALVLAWIVRHRGSVAWGLWRAAIWPILLLAMILETSFVS